MVKIIEKVTFKTGEKVGQTEMTEKKFSSMQAFNKASKNLAGHIRYDLQKKGMAEVEYTDATIKIMLIDDEAKSKILNMFGKPIDE